MKKTKQFILVEHNNGQKTKLSILNEKEDVRGKVQVNLGTPKIFEIKGRKIELICGKKLEWQKRYSQMFKSYKWITRYQNFD